MVKKLNGLLLGGKQHGRICPLRPEILADPPPWIDYDDERYQHMSYGGYEIYVFEGVPALQLQKLIMEVVGG